MINLLSVVYGRRFFSLGVAMNAVQERFEAEASVQLLQRFNQILTCGRGGVEI
jgi:hypothetical protein